MSEALIGQDQTADGLPVVTDGGAEETGTVAATDLKSRVMQGGDFAWEQIQKRDRHASELANRVKEMEPVEQLVKFAGNADRVFQLADLGNRVFQVPGLLPFVQQAIQTGRFEAPKVEEPDPEEEWIDPDVKKVSNRLQARIDDLEARLESVQGVASNANMEAQQDRVKTNMEKALKRFERDPELYAEALKTVKQRYDSAYAQAMRGDEKQRQAIGQLATDEGYGIFKFLTQDLFEENAARLVDLPNTSNTEAARAAGMKSTDARSVNPSRPGIQPLPPLSKGRVTTADYQNVFRELARRRGVDPNSL